MSLFRSMSLIVVSLLILVTPTCGKHFQNGVVEITNASGARTLRSEFHNGQIGKIGHGTIFRAQLSDGSTIMIENKEVTEPEPHK